MAVTISSGAITPLQQQAAQPVQVCATASADGSSTSSAISRSPKPGRRQAALTQPFHVARRIGRYPAAVRADGRTSPIPS